MEHERYEEAWSPAAEGRFRVESTLQRKTARAAVRRQEDAVGNDAAR